MIASSTSVRAEDWIRQRIITGVIPPNKWLRESRLAQELRVSRTPIREACNRLARDGLLEWTPQRGFRSPSLEPAELDSAYPVLVALEVLAVESTAESLETVVADLRAPTFELATAGTREAARYQVDRAWHRRLVAASENPVLAEHHDRLLGRISRYIHAYWGYRTDVDRSDSEHAQIVDALERQDLQLASALIRSHRRYGLERIRRSMDARGQSS